MNNLQDVGSWHKIFLFLPRIINGEIVMWRWVERRITEVFYDGSVAPTLESGFVFEYRIPE